MTLLPVADGARLLGIHPKTLHHWLKEANIPLATHPTDARITCVTEEHLQQVASLHGRPLQASRPLDAASPPLISSQISVPHVPENKVESASTACSFLTTYEALADLFQKLSGLETKIATLQSPDDPTHTGTAKGAGEIARASPHDPRIPHATIHGKTDPAPPIPELDKNLLVCGCAQASHPAEQLARSRMPALIAYSAPGIT